MYSLQKFLICIMIKQHAIKIVSQTFWHDSVKCFLFLFWKWFIFTEEVSQTIRALFATVVGLTIVALDWVKINWSLQIDPIKHSWHIWFLNVAGTPSRKIRWHIWFSSVAYYPGGKSVDIDILSTHTQMLTQQYWMFQETVITSEQPLFRMSGRQFQFWKSRLLKEITKEHTKL